MLHLFLKGSILLLFSLIIQFIATYIAWRLQFENLSEQSLVASPFGRSRISLCVLEKKWLRLSEFNENLHVRQTGYVVDNIVSMSLSVSNIEP